MTDLISMQVFDTCHDLLEKPGSLFILQPLLLHNIVEQFATRRILHDEEELARRFNDLIQLHNVRVSHDLQYIDFPHDSHCFLLILDFVLL